MKDKDLKYINGGNPLTFNPAGFAINPQTENAWFAGDHRDILLTAIGTAFGLTRSVIVYGSTQELPPDFTQPSTITNSYAPIVLADYSIPQTYYAGASGVAVPSLSTKIVEVNTNLLTWIAIYRTQEDVEVILTQTNAQ